MSGIGSGPGIDTGSGSGNGGGIMHQATLTLDNDAIKILPSTPVEVIAAPGENRLVLPSFTCVVIQNILTHPYDTISVNADGYMSLATSGPKVDIQDLLVNDSGIPLSSLTAFLDSSISGTNLATASVPFNQTFYAGWGIIPLGVDKDNFVNKAYFLSVDNGFTGNFTGGHADNTLIVSVAYYIYNIATGLFE